MKRILVPCDFSIPAQEAFQYAVKLALQANGELHVLYVLDITFLQGHPTLSHAYTFNVDFLREMEKEANRKFQAMWERYAPATLAAKFRHKVGSVVLETEQYIDDNAIDLVVMGTHGAGQAGWGSNTAKVVRRSPVPVIALRKHPTGPVGDIVVPVNPLFRDAAFVEEKKKLQEFFGATLHLLYVNTPLFFQKDNAMRTAVLDYAVHFKLQRYTTNFVSDYSVEEGIVSFLKQHPADLLAMGTHAWKGFWHLVLGSVAEDVVNHLSVPIWTFHVDGRK